jgi:hypothetical protein
LTIPPSDAALPTACNALSLVGVAPATARGSDAGAPEATGGTIADGTYVLTEAVYYQLQIPALSFGRSKIVISGDTLQRIENDSDPGSSDPDRTGTETINRRGSTLTLAETCPKTDLPYEVDFTLDAADASAHDADTLTIYSTDQGGTAGLVYVRQ